MALKDLSIETMAACSAAWLDPQRDRPLFEQYPLLKAMLPKLRSVHDALLLAQTGGDDSDDAAERARLEQAILDADDDFDRFARGFSRLLRGLAEISAEPAKREFWRETRGLLFPVGLKIVSLSYLDEVEALREVQAHITPEILARLDGTAIADSTLRAVFDAWVESADRLENLVRQRDALAVGEALAQTLPLGNDAFKLRDAWIRVVRTLRDSMMIEGVPQDVIDRVFGPTRSASASAEPD